MDLMPSLRDGRRRNDQQDRQRFQELQRLGLISETERTRLYGAQAAGCNPIVDAVKRGSREIRPVNQTLSPSHSRSAIPQTVTLLLA